MIRIERDPRFWSAVANHPAVRPAIVVSGEMADLAAAVSDPLVLPMASEHGGFLFYQRDGLGWVYELHTMFTPAGWGREVAEAAHEAFQELFLRGAQVVFTLEIATNRRSRPPLSHGWRTAGRFASSPELPAEARTWVLTQEAWAQSPARRRFCRHSLS
jgi:hypothetical protein